MNPSIDNAAGQGSNRSFSRHFGRRGSWAAQSIAAVSLRHCRPPQRLGERHARYLKVRKQRRRRDMIWAVLAVLVLVTSLDLASRIDEVAYNLSSPRTTME